MKASRRVLAAVGVLWGIMVSAGLGAMHAYESTPGAEGIRRDRWPQEGRVRPDPRRANLVFIAHPFCPCTRASFDELERIAGCCGDAVAIHVLLYQPGGKSGGWGTTELHRRAFAIAGARVFDDPDGTEAVRFGVATSGHALVYDQAGKLVFAGGLTAGRARAGANRASEAVVELVSGLSTIPTHAPVFGCPIRETSIIPAKD